MEEVIITAPGSVLESRYFPVPRGEPYVWRKKAAVSGDNGSSSTGIPLVSPLKEDVSYAMYRRSIYTEIKKPRWVVRAELQVVFYQLPYILILPLKSISPL